MVCPTINRKTKLQTKFTMGQEISKTDYYQEFIVSPKVSTSSVGSSSSYPSNDLSESEKDFLANINETKKNSNESHFSAPQFRYTFNQSNSPNEIRASSFLSINSAPELLSPNYNRPSSSQSNYANCQRTRLFSSQPDLHSIGCSARKQRILMLGLDGSGKSSLFQRLRDSKLRGGNGHALQPTIAYNVTSLCVDGRACTLWDVSGSPLTRDLWKHYLSGTDCLVWVVDSSNVSRIEESRASLQRMLSHRALQGVPLVVVASKQDLPTARTSSELEELLLLTEIRDKGHFVKLVTSSATSGKDTKKVMKKVKKLLGKSKSYDSDTPNDCF